jgi:hypothetical protein
VRVGGAAGFGFFGVPHRQSCHSQGENLLPAYRVHDRIDNGRIALLNRHGPNLAVSSA